MIGRMRKLNVIGAGRVGRTLAALFHRSGVLELQGVLSRTLDSAGDAVAFADAGEAIETPGAMSPADVWLIATPDRAIREACVALAESALLRDGDVVFHCSGALSSTELDAAAGRG